VTAPESILALVERFSAHREAYLAGEYNETQLRREFLDPFFEALGWDVGNKQGNAEAYKDVVHEDAIKVGGFTKAPDYSFRIGGVRKFFVEAKKPSVDIKGDPGPAFQLRRYAWSAKLPLSILTDFEEFAVYDCRLKPSPADKSSLGRLSYFRFEDYAECWEEIAGVFSRDAILKGSFDKYAEARKGKRGTTEVDRAFLEEIESWRDLLARHIALRNPTLSVRELNFAVQRIIDRIIFLRICEDRGIEDYGRLQALENGEHVYQRLVELFHRADDRYNSGIFGFREEKGRQEPPDTLTPRLHVDDEPLKTIIRDLYYPQSPYEFSVLPADILGQVYERFLGKVIRLTLGHRAVVEEKSEVKKAGGVYYTPTFVVHYIVEQTVGKLLDRATPTTAAKLKILDPACGSGSFLIAAYQRLLDWHRDWYVADGPQGHKKVLYQGRAGEWRLTTAERKRILVNSIFGVDIDPQAVEVTKLSLLLKVLEGESQESLHKQFWLLHERALPDLGANIKCGNSLVDYDFLRESQLDLLDADARSKVNCFAWEREFPNVFGDKNRGFDAVMSNPPYVLLQGEFRDDAQLTYFREHYAVASFKLDTYHLFMERGIRLTRTGGRCSMITPANFLTNNYLSGLRRLLLESASVDHIVVINKGVFAGASVDNAVFVLVPGPQLTGSFPLVTAEPTPSGFRQVAQARVSVQRALVDKHVLLTQGGGGPLGDLWDRLQASCARLGDVARVHFGKQLRDRREYPDDVVEVTGVRSIRRGYRPCYTGSDVTRYHVAWGGRACRDDPSVQRGGCWDPDVQDAKGKLLTRQVGTHPEFALDRAGHQCLNTIFMVLSNDPAFPPEYLLAVLNSRLVRALWVERFYDRRRTFPKIKGTYLKELPIVRPRQNDDALWSVFLTIAEGAKNLTKLHAAASGARSAHEKTATQRQIQFLEQETDRCVYLMYGISSQEVGLIDASLASGPATGPDSRR